MVSNSPGIPTFRFFSVNSLMRWNALNIGPVYFRKNVVGLVTASELRDQLAATPALIEQISGYAANLKGSRTY